MIIVLLASWRVMSIIWLVVVAVITGGLFYAMLPVLERMVVLITPLLVTVGAVFILMDWVYSRWLKHNVLSPRHVKIITLLVFFLAPFYFHSNFFIWTEQVAGSEQFKGHHYFLVVNRGFTSEDGIPRYLQLYECNRFALACELVYQPESLCVNCLDETRLILDEAAGMISIVVDGEVVYTHQTE